MNEELIDHFVPKRNQVTQQIDPIVSVLGEVVVRVDFTNQQL